MIVENKEMLHIHRNDLYSDIWKIGNEILVDDNFNSHLIDHIKLSSGVLNVNNNMVRLDKYINDVILKIDTEEKLLKLKELSDDDFVCKGLYLLQLLKDSRNKLGDLGIMNREEALEEVRKEKYSDLPSRYHSIWVCDEDSLNFWINKLSKDVTIYKLLLNGNLFKSSELFLPYDGETKEKQKIESEKYWNPVFDSEESLIRKEYLFQGKAKVLKLYKNN